MVNQAEKQAELRIRRQLKRNGYSLHINRDLLYCYEAEPVAADGPGGSMFFQSLSDLQAWADNLNPQKHG